MELLQDCSRRLRDITSLIIARSRSNNQRRDTFIFRFRRGQNDDTRLSGSCSEVANKRRCTTIGHIP